MKYFTSSSLVPRALLALLFSGFFSCHSNSSSPVVAPDSTLVPGPTSSAPDESKWFSQLPVWQTAGGVSVPVAPTEQLLARLPVGTKANLGPLSSSGAEPRYVAVGGSLTAGFRDGGLYRAGQLTAFPNLIARQMGLTDFRQPLFNPDQGNGTGYRQLVETAPFPKYKEVVNNRAVSGADPLALEPFKGPVDQLGVPYMGVSSAYVTEEWRTNPNIGPPTPYEPAFHPYFRRLLPPGTPLEQSPYLPFVLGQNFDFCTIELGLDDALWYACAGGFRLPGLMSQLEMGAFGPMRTLLQHLETKGIKGAVATVPDVLRFPYFHFYKAEEVRRRNGGKTLYAVVDDSYYLSEKNPRFVEAIADADLLMPRNAVNELALTGSSKPVAGLSVDNPLPSRDVLSVHEQKTHRAGVNSLNEGMRYQANHFKIPVVDLEALYNRILDGNYVTGDGLRIDPSFPQGNFFSGDGLHPTALGQAVIANEWIRVINAHYGSRIPLIDTRQFAQLFTK